jgi:hypothetical protein
MPWSIIPGELLADREASSLAKVTYAAVALRGDNCEAASTAFVLGESEAAVASALEWLADRHWIARQSVRKNGHHVYRHELNFVEAL